MIKLNLKESETSPRISLDPKNTVASVFGRSMMENAMEFYSPVLNWFRELIEQKEFDEITLNLELVYFNSSSAKQLIKILLLFEELKDKIRVNWVYPKGNDTLLNRGKELEFISELKFNYELI